jgi:hypothetical protein
MRIYKTPASRSAALQRGLFLLVAPHSLALRLVLRNPAPSVQYPPGCDVSRRSARRRNGGVG